MIDVLVIGGGIEIESTVSRYVENCTACTGTRTTMSSRRWPPRGLPRRRGGVSRDCALQVGYRCRDGGTQFGLSHGAGSAM